MLKQAVRVLDTVLEIVHSFAAIHNSSTKLISRALQYVLFPSHFSPRQPAYRLPLNVVKGPTKIVLTPA
jgi:hypothetical protein